MSQLAAKLGLVVREPVVRRRWRLYATSSGRKPVREFIDQLSDSDAAEVVAAMADVRKNGLVAARHLRGEIYEVRADGLEASYRLLFAEEGAKGRVLLGLHALCRVRVYAEWAAIGPRAPWSPALSPLRASA